MPDTQLAKELPEPAPTRAESAVDKGSPRWNWTTKLVVSLILSIVALALVVSFRDYVSLVLTAFLLTFLFRPLAALLMKHLKIGWRASVLIVYMLMAIILVGLITWGGISLFGQFQNLVKLLRDGLTSLTALLEEWSGQELAIGPFTFAIPKLTVQFISTWLAEQVQPFLGQAGNLLGGVLTGGANLVFRGVILYLVSFFVASESESSKDNGIKLSLPGYELDIKRMGKEVGRIWNAFLRGQFVVVGTAILVYSLLLGVLGMPSFLGLAVIAGLGRFIPYVGAWISWIAFGLVAVFASPTPYGLLPLAYGAIVVGIALVVDNLLDNILTPKVMGEALRVHPAAVLISALLGSKLLGLIGIILAAPTYATIKLVVQYMFRKLTDQDPWAGIAYYQKPRPQRLFKWFTKTWKKTGKWLKKAWKTIKAWFAQQKERITAGIEKRRSQRNSAKKD